MIVGPVSIECPRQKPRLAHSSTVDLDVYKRSWTDSSAVDLDLYNAFRPTVQCAARIRAVFNTD
jgi:hypothetical protein